MGWTTKDFDKIVKQSRELIMGFFNNSDIDLSIPVMIASSRELEISIIEELKEFKYSAEVIDEIKKYDLPFVIGKYFSNKKEIWVLNEKGENLGTVVHEILHSIQKCEPNRERIVSYLTYRITAISEAITTHILDDWGEIERIHTLKGIKRRLLTIGDCEDF